MIGDCLVRARWSAVVAQYRRAALWPERTADRYADQLSYARDEHRMTEARAAYLVAGSGAKTLEVAVAGWQM